MKDKLDEIMSILFERGGLTEEHRRFLLDCGLSETAFTGRLISGNPVVLDKVFPELEKRGLVSAAIELGILVEERGSTTWGLDFAWGGLLVQYRGRDGRPLGVSRLGSGTMLPAGPCVFGLDRLSGSSEYPIVGRKELTSMVLAQVGFDVVAVPGPLEGIRTGLERLLEVLKKVRPTKVYVLVEGDRLPASQPSAGTSAFEDPAADARAFALSVARQIEFAGLGAEVLDLGAAGLPQAGPEGSSEAARVETMVVDAMESSAPWAAYLEKQTPELRGAVARAWETAWELGRRAPNCASSGARSTKTAWTARSSM